MLQPKDAEWLNGYKNKTDIYAVYKKPTSDLKTHTNQTKTKHKENIKSSKGEATSNIQGKPHMLNS